MRKQKPVSFFKWVAQLHWGVKTATAVFVFFAAMGSAAATWDKFGWWVPASIHYVNDKLNPISRSVQDTQIEQAEGKRDATEERIFLWQDKLKETSDPERQRAYRERIHELEITKRKQEQQINTLNRAKGP
jgi:hypothetical protein